MLFVLLVVGARYLYRYGLLCRSQKSCKTASARLELSHVAKEQRIIFVIDHGLYRSTPCKVAEVLKACMTLPQLPGRPVRHQACMLDCHDDECTIAALVVGN